MISAFANMFKIPELRARVLFTLAIIVIAYTDSIDAAFRPGSISTSHSTASIRTGAMGLRTSMLAIAATGLSVSFDRHGVGCSGCTIPPAT